MFYNIFCELCRKRGLTPSGAASQIGFNRASITMWKNTGKAPKQDLLIRISKFFDVSVDYLLGTEENAPAISDKRNDHDNTKNVIRIAGRDGSYQERQLSDEQLAALRAILDQMPDAPQGL